MDCLRKKNHAGLWMAVLCGLLLSACAGNQPLGRPGGNATSALEYYQWLETADVEAVNEDIRRFEVSDREPRSVIDSVQLALALSVPPGSSENNRLEALRILNRTVSNRYADSRSREYSILGRLWLKQLNMERELDRLQMEQDRRVRSLQTQIGELQQQIEALTNIEQQLIEREQSQVAP